MQLTGFGIEERFLFEDVPCEKIDNGEIISTSGRLEFYSLDEFFRSRDASFTFKITNVSQKIAVKCTISMFDNVRQWNRKNIPNYIEFFLKVSDEILFERNQKNL